MNQLVESSSISLSMHLFCCCKLWWSSEWLVAWLDGRRRGLLGVWLLREKERIRPSHNITTTTTNLMMWCGTCCCYAPLLGFSLHKFLLSYKQELEAVKQKKTCCTAAFFLLLLGCAGMFHHRLRTDLVWEREKEKGCIIKGKWFRVCHLHYYGWGRVVTFWRRDYNNARERRFTFLVICCTLILDLTRYLIIAYMTWTQPWTEPNDMNMAWLKVTNSLGSSSPILLPSVENTKMKNLLD